MADEATHIAQEQKIERLVREIHEDAPISGDAYEDRVEAIMDEVTEYAVVRVVEALDEKRAPSPTDAPSFCTRYVSGEGRHRVQTECPLAPGVPCSPESEVERAAERGVLLEAARLITTAFSAEIDNWNSVASASEMAAAIRRAASRGPSGEVVTYEGQDAEYWHGCAETMREALERIAEGRGRFSRDELTFASNTIEDMKAIANEALAGSSPSAGEAVANTPPPDNACEVDDCARHGGPTVTDERRELLPWEVRIPKSMVVGDVNAESSCHVYFEDGGHWMRDRDGATVPLMILRDDHQRLRVVDDTATDLVATPPTSEDERAGMEWWNGLPESVRGQWLEHARNSIGGASAADAWECYKRTVTAGRQTPTQKTHGETVDRILEAQDDDG